MSFTKDVLEKLHATALKQFEAIQDKERKSREQAIEDMRFTNVVGAQSEDAFDKREDVYRGEINRVAGLVDQVTGGNRENRSNIKFLPTGNSADNESAEVKSGLARNIENESDANTIYDQAFDESVTGGYGGWRLLTEYEDDGFDQRIVMEAIDSAASSLYFDVNARKYTREDAKHAFLVTGVHPDLFESEYPDATVTEFPVETYSDKNWYGEDQILTAEYWWKEPVTKSIAQLSDGRVIDVDEEKAVLDEIKSQGITIKKERKLKTHKVYMAKMSGAEWLSEPKEFPSKYIGLVPEYGRISHIENEVYVRGLIRFAKDSQRIYNYETSNQVQLGAEALDDPVLVTANQVKNYKEEWEGYKVDRPFALPYDHDPDTLPPHRLGAPSVQQNSMMRIKQAEMDIYATTNMYPPSLGLNVGLESGVALEHQDEKGDRGSYVFVDNHMKSIKYSGQIIEDMIGRVYDAERMVAILNIDGSVESKTINEIQRSEIGEIIRDEQTGKEVTVNDMSVNFGTVVDVSPAYNTQKKESLDQLIAMIGADETFRAISTDLVAKNSNILESDELYKRARKLMINQGLVDPTDDEVEEFNLLDQPEPAPDPQMALVEMQQAVETEKLKLERDKFELEEDKIKADLDDKDEDRKLKARELDLKEREQALKSKDKEVELEKARIASATDIRIAEINAASKDKETASRANETPPQEVKPPVFEVTMPEITVSQPDVTVNIDSGGDKKITIERQEDGSLTGKSESLDG